MTTKELPAIEVSVGVIRHQNQFLVARRHTHQHEGGKLEFIGGKVDKDEKPITALIRETSEELGLDISQSTISPLGTIAHRYADKDKVVHLWVFEVVIDKLGYLAFKDTDKGLEGQALFWYGLDELFARRGQFPCANGQIFEWITPKP